MQYGLTPTLSGIVNGNKYKVDYYFGIVDVSSAMKRVESSKEASRNLVVIDPDGSTEWQEVTLTPANWAAICKEKVDLWRDQNNSLSRKDYESEIDRLNRLLSSYAGLRSHLDPKGEISTADAAGVTKPPADDSKKNNEASDAKKTNDAVKPKIDAVTTSESPKAESEKLEAALVTAYKELYEAQSDPAKIEDIPVKQTALEKALKANGEANLTKNKKVASDLAKMSKGDKVRWLDRMIGDVQIPISELRAGLERLAKGSVAAPVITDVIKAESQEAKGKVVT